MGLEEILLLKQAHRLYWESEAQRSSNYRLKYISFLFHLLFDFHAFYENSSPQQFIEENLCGFCCCFPLKTTATIKCRGFFSTRGVIDKLSQNFSMQLHLKTKM